MTKQQNAITSFITQYIKLETLAGLLLIFVSALAIIFANIEYLAPIYNYIQHLNIGVVIGDITVKKTLLHWINDGLMTLFFFLITLEIKREATSGELSTINKAMMPVIGAIGGMIIPALIYVYYNLDHPKNLPGWAIPTATDIAFALGILTLLGKRVPITLKVFLTTLAVVDDLLAIIILAIFYTEDVNIYMLVAGIAVAISMLIMAQRQVVSASISLFLGFILWSCLLKSGIHPTLAGVVTAITIPRKCKKSHVPNPLEYLEHSLHGWVTFLILPMFAFINAGVPINLSTDNITVLSLSIIVALFVGKQIGVFGFCYLALKSKLANLPNNVSILQLYGVSVLCGIGFTMSLFIGSIPFSKGGEMDAVRIGVLGASILSSIWGTFILYISSKKDKQK